MKKELQYFRIECAWEDVQLSQHVTAVFSLICTEEQTCILLAGRKSQKQNICNLE